MKTETRSTSVLKPVLFLILGLMMIGAAWWLTERNSAREKIEEERRKFLEQQKVKRQRQEFFALNGIQLLNQEQQSNLEMMERARQRFASSFSRYRSGVPRFAEDLTTWGTRYEITKTVLADWWSDSNEARKVATDRFSKFVVSDAQLQKDVTAAIAQFSSDLEANRNNMLSELQVKVLIAAIPCASKDVGLIKLQGAFKTELEPLLKKMAVESPLVSILGGGGGSLAGVAATQVVKTLLKVIPTRIATGAATRGSAVAAAAIAGGSGGSIAPGVGTVIGLTAGIIGGCAVDWWTERRFKEKVKTECNQILNDMEKNLWDEPKHGLNVTFNQLVKVTRESHEVALRRVIIGE